MSKLKVGFVGVGLMWNQEVLKVRKHQINLIKK